MSIPIFVSTRETQGQRENDFCTAPEDGLVIFSVRPCEHETDDPECSCRRSMTCITTKEQTHTTTMKVIIFEGSADSLDEMIKDFLRDEGWVRPAYVQNIDNNYAARLSQEAAKFPVGTVVEYRDGVFSARGTMKLISKF